MTSPEKILIFAAMNIKDTLRGIRERLPDRFFTWVRRLVMVTITLLIVYQLWDIGWMEVLNNLPVHPMFYILMIFIYITLPTAELLLYRRVWPLSRRYLFKTFLVKRVYNEEVIGYSGELFLFARIRGKIDRSDREIMRDIRDNNIISAITSNFVAIALVGVLIFFEIIPVSSLLPEVNWLYIGTGVFIVAVVTVLAIQFRKHLFAMSLPMTLRNAAIYFSRFVLHHALLVAQWTFVLPDTPVYVWMIYISLVIVLNRVPLLPAKDLVFLWAGIELSRTLDVATAGVAGMLIVSSALVRVSNLIMYLIFSRSVPPGGSENGSSDQ